MKKQALFIYALIAVVTIAICSFTLAARPKAKNCMMAVTYSEMAMIQFKKAYKAKTIEVLRPAMKKGIDQILQASTYAVQCDCAQSESNALTAYGIAKKAYDKLTDIDELKRESKKAMDLSITAMAAAQRCDK